MTETDVSAFDALQMLYIDALDRQDMDGWLATFANEATYVCRSAENEESGLEISYILDDCRDRIEDRVKFVTRVWAGTYQKYRTRHIVQRLATDRLENGLLSVRSNFCVTMTRSDTNRTEMFASGIYLDLAVPSENGLRFASKKVIADAAMLPHYMVYPL